MPEAEREERAGRVRRSMWLGFGFGILLGLATSAIDFAWRGWPYISGALGFNLVFYPFVAALIARNAALRRGDPKPSRRDFRFGMATLMILTAYLAFYLAVMARTARLGGVARAAQNNSRSARTMADIYRRLLDQALRDKERSKNAEELRAGRIPPGLDPSQAAFLKSLDGTATEEYRKYRYGLIADGEQHQADLGAANVDTFRRQVDYRNQLAEKYARVTLQPWLPIPPDPPGRSDARTRPRVDRLG